MPSANAWLQSLPTGMHVQVLTKDVIRQPNRRRYLFPLAGLETICHVSDFIQGVIEIRDCISSDS